MPPPPAYRSAPPPRTETKVVEVESAPVVLELFREREWSVDVFGLFAFEASDGEYDDGFGPGLGVNYFFNRYIGFGMEGYGWDANGWVGSAGGNLILRYPLDEFHIAPYIIGGVGGNFGGKDTGDQVNGGGGLGFEVRFNEHWGIFSDARYILTEKTNDYAIARTGIRFSF